MRRENAKSSNAIDATESAEEGSFFRRWSSRKRRARRERTDEVPAEASVEESKAVENDAAGEPERVLTDEDMPPLDSLNEESDYSGFMSPGVSESLRNLALRKMFLSSKYNFTDGLDDYADDFTKFAPLGDIITSDMRHQIEMQAERAKQKLEEEARAAMDNAPSGEVPERETAAGETSEVDSGGEDAKTLAGEDATTQEPAADCSTEDDSRGT
ncbi:MAG: DUF3306 domain-containing protein [Gammaproteobacteria bacterium]|nr:DUF3306 domain-containing protein [Gammaproteobacteria bacterium]